MSWSETVPCPYCREPVYEDAERCPQCGNYLSQEDAPSRRPAWIYVCALICLILALGWAFSAW